MSDLRQQLDALVSDVPVYGDLDRAIEQAEAERSRRATVVTVLATAAAVLIAVVGTIAVVRGGDTAGPQPIGPVPSPTPTTAGWTGPIRPGALPVVVDELFGWAPNRWRGWSDPRDTTPGQIDIRVLSGWGVRLQEDDRLEQWLDDASRVVEYGVVADTDGDRVADCQLALSTSAPGRGRTPADGPTWRVLVKNLDSGVTDERVGPPYGYPLEFGFPDDPPGDVSLYVEFLGEWRPPCAAPTAQLNWYAYASLAEDGRVTAWDFAPDDGWLTTPWRKNVPFGGQIGRTRWGSG